MKVTKQHTAATDGNLNCKSIKNAFMNILKILHFSLPFRTMTHLNLSLCVFLLIFAAHSTCFVLNKFVHENGVKGNTISRQSGIYFTKNNFYYLEFTVEKLIKKNNCICTCSCVPKNVPIEPEAPQLPEFAHKRQLWKGIIITLFSAFTV